MAVLKCKMCGGDLNISADEKIAECEFCGTTQTIPDANDEKKANLFNRANRLRMDNEFDKAASVYENIVSEFPDEAEGYWGIVLCKYGIEYVDDPKTGKKIPTCHRTLTSSIMDDDNFNQAFENATIVARGVYREEAKAIDLLQKKILSVSENEDPYDVFICYKETDTITNKRTEDSLIAQDIYTELIKEGYRVFFSRVSLRGKAGTEYEPYIYSALKTSKVMLAIGTKFDYYDAVWVKNEWSRYLSMMANDNSKHLIPCFKNLDAYDIPKEFKNLQALDMTEVTFFKNLTESVERFIPKAKTEQVVVSEVSVKSAATAESLIKRGFMFLEEGRFQGANECFEKALDVNPECGDAYLGKLLTEFQVRKKEDLKNVRKPFNTSTNYQKAIRFSDESLKTELDGYLECVGEKVKASEDESAYMEARLLIGKDNYESYEKAAELFSKLSGFKDSDTLKEQCRKKLEVITLQRTKNFSERQELYCVRAMQTAISAGASHTIGLKKDGTVISTRFKGNSGFYKGQCNVNGWKNIFAISAGACHSVGLKIDGTVIATEFTGKSIYYTGQCDVSGWKDILAVSASDCHTVGLKKDGTVVAAGNNTRGECNVSSWTDIIAIAADSGYTIGLKKDGTCVATGNNDRGQLNVSSWKHLFAISALNSHTVGLLSDGTVVATGYNKYGQCDVSSWKEIVAISAGAHHTVGLKMNGTVVAAGYNEYGQCEVEHWKDIVAISASRTHTVGLKKDGTVISTEFIGKSDYNDGQCDVHNLKDIKFPINVRTKDELVARMEQLTREQAAIAEQMRLREEARLRAEAQEREIQLRRERFRNAGVCQHCGGSFKGLFTKTCMNCGKEKDYI